VDDEFCLLIGLNFEEQQTFGAGRLSNSGDLVGELGTLFLLILCELVEAFLNVLLRFAHCGCVIWETLVSGEFDIALFSYV